MPTKVFISYKTALLHHSNFAQCCYIYSLLKQELTSSSINTSVLLFNKHYHGIAVSTLIEAKHPRPTSILLSCTAVVQAIRALMKTYCH